MSSSPEEQESVVPKINQMFSQDQNDRNDGEGMMEDSVCILFFQPVMIALVLANLIL